MTQFRRTKQRHITAIVGATVWILSFCFYAVHKVVPSSPLEIEKLASLPWTKMPPSLPVGASVSQAPKTIEPKDLESIREWGWPHIHIVSTRFMQDQGNFTTLGKARLALFKTFCLATMRAQTSQAFLWIIRTDPNLDEFLRIEMIGLLKDHPTFFLVASNDQGRFNKNILRPEILTGNRTLLEWAVELRSHLPLLETRLDADDGLRVQFIERIQHRALNDLTGEGKKRWLFYCIQSAMEWRWYKNETYGSFLDSYKKSFCVTPGLTLGIAAGVGEDAVPKDGKHSALLHTLKKLPKNETCGWLRGEKCLVFLGDSTHDAIRSRTPTSAGMEGVVKNRVTLLRQLNETFPRLKQMHADFRISRHDLKMLNTYMEKHILDIAKDNLKGQCTPGHSCKPGAKAHLEMLLDKESWNGKPLHPSNPYPPVSNPFLPIPNLMTFAG